MSVVDFSGNGHVIPVDVSSCDVRFDLSFGSSNWSDYNKVYVHYSNRTYVEDTIHTHVKEIEVTEANFNRKSVTIPNIHVFHSDTDLVVDDISKNQYEFQIYHLDKSFIVQNGVDDSAQVDVYGHMYAPIISDVVVTASFAYTLNVEVPHYADISNDISGFLVTTGGPAWNTNISAGDAQEYDYNAYSGVSDNSLNNYVLNTTFIAKSAFTYTLSGDDATFDLRVCDPYFAWESIPDGHLTREVINAKDITNFTKFRIENSIRILEVDGTIGLISNTVDAAGDSLPSPMTNISLATNHDNLDAISHNADGKGSNKTVNLTGNAPVNMPTNNEYDARIFYTQQDISSSYIGATPGVINYLSSSLNVPNAGDMSGADLSGVLTSNSWSMTDVSLYQKSGDTAWYLDTDLSGLQDGSAVYVIVQMKDSYGSYEEYTPIKDLLIKTITPYAPPPKISNISASPHGTQDDATKNYVYQDSTDIHVDFSLNQYVPSEVGDITQIVVKYTHNDDSSYVTLDVSGNVEVLSYTGANSNLARPFNVSSDLNESYRLNISNSDISLTQGEDISLSLLFATDYYNNTGYAETTNHHSSLVDISVVDTPDLLSGVTFTAVNGDISNVKGFVRIEVPAGTVTGTWDEYLNKSLYYNGNATMHNLSNITLDEAKAHAITNNYEAFSIYMGDSIDFFEAGSYDNNNTSSNFYDSYILSSTTTTLSGTDGMGNNYSDLSSIPVTLFIEPVGDIATDASNVFVNAFTDLSNVDRSVIEHPMYDVSQPRNNQANLVYHTSLTRQDTDSDFELDVYSPLDVVDFSYSIAVHNDKYKLSSNTSKKDHTYESDGPSTADLIGDLNWSSKTQLVTKHGFTNTLTVVDGPFEGDPNHNNATIKLTFRETEDGFYGRGDFSNNCVVVLVDTDTNREVPSVGGELSTNKPTQYDDLTVIYDVSAINQGDISNGHTFTYYLKNSVTGITGPDASGIFHTRRQTDPPTIELVSSRAAGSYDYSYNTPNITPSVIDYIVVTMPGQDNSGANYGGDVSYNDNQADYKLIIELLKNGTTLVNTLTVDDNGHEHTYQNLNVYNDLSNNFDISVNHLYTYSHSGESIEAGISNIPQENQVFLTRLINLDEQTPYTVQAKVVNTINTVTQLEGHSSYFTLSVGTTDADISDNAASFGNVKPTLTANYVNDTFLDPPLNLEHVELSWDPVEGALDSRVYGYVVIATISGEDYTIWSGDETTTDVSFHSGHKFFATYHERDLSSSDIASTHDDFLNNLASSFNLPEIKTPIYGLPITYRVRTVLIDQDDVIYTGNLSYNSRIDSDKTHLTPKTRPTIESVTVNYGDSGDSITSFDISLSTGGDDLDKVLVLVTGENMNPVVHQASELSNIPVSGFHSHVLTPLQDISFAGTGAEKDNDSIIMINSPQGGNLYYLNDLKNGITTATITTATDSDLFFSGYGEGDSNNKYLQIYNPTDQAIGLSNYALAAVVNAPSNVGQYEYWDTFQEGAIIGAGEVYVIAYYVNAHQDILDHANETTARLSNGDDGFKLVKGTESDYVVLDTLGDFQGDPGSGWDVAGVTEATKNHTLVRKSHITGGNTNWTASAGTTTANSEWIVYTRDDFNFVGSWTSTTTTTTTNIKQYALPDPSHNMIHLNAP